jgi:hypothetical protein
MTFNFIDDFRNSSRDKNRQATAARTVRMGARGDALLGIVLRSRVLVVMV